VTTKTRPDSRIRYYTEEIPVRREGPTRGALFVTEYNPATGSARQWMESYNQSGNVIRVQASAAVCRERIAAARAGKPYSETGQVGHVPDTALSGKAEPPGGWLDMAGKPNDVAGGGLSSRIGQPLHRMPIDGKSHEAAT